MFSVFSTNIPTIDSRGQLERDARDDWRDLGEAGNIGGLMKGVCHGAFVSEVESAEAIAS